MKRTPLYDKHCELGGKIIDFNGWALPVQYSGIIEEHRQVRNAAGLFDVSHMGEIIVEGPDATGFIQKIITNDISKTRDFRVVYSPMCYPDGGVVDDILIYKYSDEFYLLIVNASNTEKDYDWLSQNIEGKATIRNVSDYYAQLALQGPESEKILQKLVDIDLKGLKFFNFAPEVEIAGHKAVISRSGYTGEDGFEIYIKSDYANELWDALMQAGKDCGLVPAGLGARDTLRFEVALPLYGHEISPDITPLEAGLDRFVKLDKENFIGKDALIEQKSTGVKRKIAGFEMVDRGVPRAQYDILADGKKIGFVTSGSYSPSLEKNLGIALLETAYAEPGTEVDIAIRNRALKARITVLPFYTKKYTK
ncbi:MAG: glycine cleavage system aminomethyltransferase GcvT [Clostridiaceae bacterium]|nr:glycine cleavage system aminomethyltransferase GcvT [Clostridiaceae bacterium]